MADNAVNDGKSKADSKDPHAGWVTVDAATGNKAAKNADKVQLEFATAAEAENYKRNLNPDSSLVTSGAATGQKTEKVESLSK